MTTSTTKAGKKTTVGIDLDALEADGATELAPSFEFTAGGRTFTASNPQLLPWQEYADLDPSNTAQILERMLGEEQFAAFGELGVSKWKLDRLARALGEHFDPDRSTTEK